MQLPFIEITFKCSINNQEISPSTQERKRDKNGLEILYIEQNCPPFGCRSKNGPELL